MQLRALQVALTQSVCTEPPSGSTRGHTPLPRSLHVWNDPDVMPPRPSTEWNLVVRRNWSPVSNQAWGYRGFSRFQKLIHPPQLPDHTRSIPAHAARSRRTVGAGMADDHGVAHGPSAVGWSGTDSSARSGSKAPAFGTRL